VEFSQAFGIFKEHSSDYPEGNLSLQEADVYAIVAGPIPNTTDTLWVAVAPTGEMIGFAE